MKMKILTSDKPNHLDQRGLEDHQLHDQERLGPGYHVLSRDQQLQPHRHQHQQAEQFHSGCKLHEMQSSH